MTATSYRYTGQREEAGFGLYLYNARWYDPALGRFVQADSIVPGGVQGLDRYAYVNNSPVRYIDPSGHCSGKPDDPKNPDKKCWDILADIENTYENVNVLDQDKWTYNELIAIWQALEGHVLIEDILSAKEINFYRESVFVDENGKMRPGIAGATGRNAMGGYDITIFDSAYTTPPDVNSISAPASIQNFKGAIIHELTHVAIHQNPAILESYKETESQNPWLWSYPHVGHRYNWKGCAADPYCNPVVERISVIASALQVSNSSLDGDWRKSWIQSLRQTNPILDACKYVTFQ